MSQTMSEALVKKLIDQQNALASFGSFAFRNTDLHAILTKATEICARGVDAAMCKICRYRPEHNDLIIEAGYGWKCNVIGVALSKADETTPGGYAFVSRQPTICPNVKDENFVLPRFYEEHQIISTANVVILGTDGDDPYGILEIDSTEPLAYTEQDIAFLTGFANVLADAVATSRRTMHLQNLLNEKEVLSRELQHRVRNNLQLIHSMLDVEAETSAGADERFRDIANRVKALSAVYDHLLGTGMARTLEFDQYLVKLCMTLSDVRPRNVELVQRPMSTITVDLDTATILGIAITEIITNSFKHAFPEGKGTIELGLENQPAPIIYVQDDGIGIDTSRATKRRGLGLVSRLVEQVNGSFDIRRTETGTHCQIVLPQPKA